MTNKGYSIAANTLSIVENVRFAIVVDGPCRAYMRPIHRMTISQSWVLNPQGKNQAGMRLVIKQAIEALLRRPVRRPNLIFAKNQALQVRVHFYMERPPNHFTSPDTRYEAALKEQYLIQRNHTVFPDIDNLAKYLMDDPLENLVYFNDCNVCSILARKSWDNFGACRGRTEIEIVPVEFDLTNDD